jgi:hypothetical protein
VTTIISGSEEVRRALAWISDRRREDPKARTLDLVDEAGRRFNLSPIQEQWLLTTLTTP